MVGVFYLTLFYYISIMDNLYSDIENLIIRWNIDGTKTAGYLTRQIMECIITQKHKYVIIDLRNMDYMKDKDGNIIYYNTEEEAGIACGIYEFEDAWIMKLVYNHKERID